MATTFTPQWITSAGLLGTATELTTTTFSISISNATTSTTMSVISGKLPTGFSLTTSTSSYTSLITGSSPSISRSTSSQFVIRAANDVGITDRTFNINITNTASIHWITSPTLNDTYIINKSMVDFQLEASADVGSVLYYIATPDSFEPLSIPPYSQLQLPPGLTLSRSGKLSGIVDDPALTDYALKQYTFYVTATDGITDPVSGIYRLNRAFTLSVAGVNALKADTTILDADNTIFDADSSSLVLPNWLDTVDLGTVRANNHHVIQMDQYDAYPKIGPTLFDWVTASVIPVTKGLSDSPSDSTGYQLVNRENDNTIYLKNIDELPLIGQIFRLDPYVDGANTTEYEIITVTEPTVGTCTITFGIRLNDNTIIPTVLPVRILDNVELYFGTQTQHPPNFHLDPDSGSIYGTFDFNPKYTTSYTFPVRIFKIDVNNELLRYMGPWKVDRYYRANDIVRVKTELDQPGKPNNGHILTAEDLPVSGNIIGDKYVSIYNSHLWVYTGVGPINGFVDVGHVTYSSQQTDHYTYYIALNTDPISDPITSEPVLPPSFFDTTKWKLFDLSGTNVSFKEKVFTLTVRGDIKNGITFITDSNLGSFIAGYQSEQVIRAAHITEPLEITYNVSKGILPPGIELQYDGTLTGKVPYDFNTAFDFILDNNVYNFDTQFNFTVSANDVFDRGITTRDYVSSISQSDPTNYTHIYATPRISADKRDVFSQFINDETVFNPSALYRPNDPEFGVQRILKAYIEHGIEQIKLDDYAEPLRKYFWKKRFYFGKIQSKAAYDENKKYVYDAVYVEIIDPFVNNDGISISSYLNSANVTIFPNSAFNIQSTLEAITINNVTVKTDQFLRPRFMRTVQVGTGAPLGFVLAAPLCYALPGAGDSIVKQAELYNFNFSTLDFEIDRLIVEDSLPKQTAKYMLFPRREVVGSDTGINITDYRLYGDDNLEIDTEGNDPLYLEI